MSPATSSTTLSIGKRELCAALSWARSTLDRRLDQDRNFPVMTRGGRSGGWQFDLAEVQAYLGGEPPAPARPAGKGGRRDKALDPAAGAAPHLADEPARVTHRGEVTASQRLKNAQAAREEDRLRKDRKELVEAEEMRLVLGTMLARLGKGLDGLPDMIVRRLGLAEETADVLREMVDGLRREMVADLKPLLDN